MARSGMIAHRLPKFSPRRMLPADIFRVLRAATEEMVAASPQTDPVVGPEVTPVEPVAQEVARVTRILPGMTIQRPQG